MKARELIEILQRMNPDAEVVFPQGEFDDLGSFDFAGYNPENPRQIVLDDSNYRWECNQPQPYRELSEYQKRIKTLTQDAMNMWLTHYVDGLAKKPAYLSDLPMINGPLRIRTPEI